VTSAEDVVASRRPSLVPPCPCRLPARTSTTRTPRRLRAVLVTLNDQNRP